LILKRRLSGLLLKMMSKLSQKGKKFTDSTGPKKEILK
jgi:hypothetical protein